MYHVHHHHLLRGNINPWTKGREEAYGGGVSPLDLVKKMKSYIRLSQKLICGFQANMGCCQWQFDFCISRSQRSGGGRGSACISPIGQGWALCPLSPSPLAGVSLSWVWGGWCGSNPLKKQNSDVLKGSCRPLLAGSCGASWTVRGFCKARRQNDCVICRVFTKG